jgi:predicted Zn-dependent protease
MSDRADEEFEKALTVRPGNHAGIVPAYLFLADRFLASGQTARAAKLLRHGVARFPSNTKLLYKLSEALGSSR